ncbi:MAG: hypothetical protein K6A95_09330 [Bacteroidales bacterium]|nr:hypothetical protein [Bacteroidales bacterium]
MKPLPLKAIWKMMGILSLAILAFSCEKEPITPDPPKPDPAEIDIPGGDSNILIMKVDYKTFQYEGYTTVNVDSTNNSSDTIPFLATYCPPGDFGYIKLFYENPSHLLFYGNIIWMGCGNLLFPTSFMELPAQTTELPFPENDRICLIDYTGAQQTLPWNTGMVDETMMENVWETISKQPEFQYYYSKTNKKVAVYLYTPSVGGGNPADWDFIVFVEKSE